MTITDTSVDFLGVNARPDVYTQIAADPDVQMLISQMGGSVGTAAYNDRTGMEATGIASAQFQPLSAPLSFEQQAQFSATALLPQDMQKASIDHAHFGQGYVSTYRSDLPSQGIQTIRPAISAPTLVNPDDALFGMPAVGPLAGFQPGAHAFLDPRFTQPTLGRAQATFAYPSAGGLANGPGAGMKVNKRVRTQG